MPKEWADKYKGVFDDGWEAYREKVFARQKEMGIVPADGELSRHDPDVPEWDSLSADERRLYSRMMEVFAGFLEHTDHHIGRVLDYLKSIDEFDNTLVMVISDNGASAEGGPTGTTNEAQFFNNAQEPFEESLKSIDEIGGPKHFNHYPWGWTWAGNTPFRRWKRETYRGGSCDPFIVAWPKGIEARGEVRQQYAHIIDMVPTVLELVGIEPPDTVRGVTQSPLQGVSFADTLNDAGVESDHHTQYFEMLGHRAIYHDGWRAVCPWPGPSFKEAGKPFGEPISADTLTDLDAHGWELYHVAEDFAENHNVAEENREKLIEMIGRWYVEAGKYDVFPVDGSGLARMVSEKPLVGAPRDSYTYFPNTQSIPYFAAPKVLNRPHSITAAVEIPEDGAEGVLLCQGTAAGGYSFFVKDGKASLRAQLGRQRAPARAVRRGRNPGRARVAIRVRATRSARHREGSRHAGKIPALHRRQARRGCRLPLHDAVCVQPGAAHLRREPRLDGHTRLQGAIPVHRHAAERQGRPEWRAHQRRRGRAAHAPRKTVGKRMRSSAR